MVDEERVLVSHDKYGSWRIKVDTSPTLAEFTEDALVPNVLSISAVKNKEGRVEILVHVSRKHDDVCALIYSLDDIYKPKHNLLIGRMEEIRSGQEPLNRSKSERPQLPDGYVTIGPQPYVDRRGLFDARMRRNAKVPRKQNSLSDLLFWIEHSDDLKLFSRHAKRDTVLLFSRPIAPITFMALGTGSGLSSKPNTCFVLELNNGARYYIDFPRNMYDAGDLSKVKNVILTHNDPDHEGDLVRLLQEKAFTGKEKVNILTAKPIFDSLVSKVPQTEAKAAANFVDISPGKPHEFQNGLQIETRWNVHGDLPTIGLRLSHGGKTLAYSADTKYLGETLVREITSDLEKVLGASENTSLYVSPKQMIISAYNKVFEKLGYNPISVLRNVEIEEIMQKVYAKGLQYELDKTPHDIIWVRQGHSKIDDDEATLEEIKKFRDEIAREARLYLREKLSIGWLARDADIILHEAWPGENPVHTNVGTLTALPREVRERMYLVHAPDDFECPDELKMLKERRKYRI